MRRIGLAVVLALGLSLFSLSAEAQQVRRIGVLSATPPEEGSYLYSLRDGLLEFGYVDGQNIAVEWRWARGKDERLPDLAAELVRLPVDVIVVTSNATIVAAQRATRTIPIVTVVAVDPVGF